MLVHHRLTPSIKFAANHLYTWVERGTMMRVKCLAQEHNTMSLAQSRARSRITCSGVECTNHEATAPPQYLISSLALYMKMIITNFICSQHDTSSSLDIIANNLTKEVTNGRQEQGVDEVEFMSSSSSSSSSDSP